MLVIDNGAFKSGSSWLFKILRCLTDFPPPPKEYLNPDWVNPSIYPDKLADFLENVDYSSNNYLCKNHFGRKKERELILSYSDVFVVGIKRDIRDVVVSAYYHYRRVEGYSESFKTYYWTRGRRVAESVRNYNQTWNIKSPNLYVSSYESLKSDPHLEIKNIANLLGFFIAEETINRILKETSFEAMKKPNDSGHARKGIVGDWQNHLDEAMIKDIEKIEEKGLGNFTKIEKATAKIYAFSCQLKPFQV